ncbi:MAG TPA: gas vesicle protein K [Vicinamibacterales bacterium]
MPAARPDSGDQEGDRDAGRERRQIEKHEHVKKRPRLRSKGTKPAPVRLRKASASSRKSSLESGERRRTPRRPELRWNPDPDDVQRSVVKLVLSLIEFVRKLMERQAVRRLEEKTLTAEEIENVGIALMKLEQTVHQLAKRFKLDPNDLNLDLGPIGKLH